MCNIFSKMKHCLIQEKVMFAHVYYLSALKNGIQTAWRNSLMKDWKPKMAKRKEIVEALSNNYEDFILKPCWCVKLELQFFVQVRSSTMCHICR